MSPVYARTNGLVFYFFLADLVGGEPAHAHVGIGKSMTPADGKIWLDPEVAEAKKGRLNQQQMRDAVRIANDNQETWLQVWRSYERSRG